MLIQKGIVAPATPLFQCDPLTSALPAALEHIAPSRYEANAMIYAQGDPGGQIYLVERGAVRVCRLTIDGRRQINGFAFPGDVFGIENQSERQFYAEAIEPTTVRAIRITDAIRNQPVMMDLVLECLERTQRHLMIVGRPGALERVAAFLLDTAARQGASMMVELAMSRSDIGDYLGLTLETVSRVLRKLSDLGLIRLATARRIVLLERDKLALLRD